MPVSPQIVGTTPNFAVLVEKYVICNAGTNELESFFLLLKIVGPPYFAVWVEQYFNCDGGGASVTAKH